MELKENRIVLFTADQLTKGPTEPAYQGEAQVDGKHYSVALWLEKSKKGIDYLSGKIEPWHAKEPAQPPPSNRSFPDSSMNLKEQAPQKPEKGDEEADDLPF